MIAIVAIGLFGVDVEAETTPEPVSFDETVPVGLTLSDELRLETEDQNVALPRVQVFYSQYPYVVGYYGVERYLAAQDEPAHDQQFGYPLAAYVSVYEDQVRLTDEGYPRTDGAIDWYPVEDALYVVDSQATTPAGEAVVAFASADRAVQFRERYGGEIRYWTDVRDRSFDSDDATTVRERTATQHQHADDLIENATASLDRPESVVVGEDAETIQEAIDGASSGETVVVPNGTYHESIEIDRSLTVQGSGDTHLVGPGKGTVLNVTADEVAVTSLTISGVGGETPGAGATDDHVHDHGDADDADEAWDADIEDDYARGDAGIAVSNATGVLIDQVRIQTPASGIMLLDSPESVITNSTVIGHPDYREAHMGVVAMRSPGVIQHSTFEQGLDGVYTHRADGIVVRNNRMTANRMGVHMMHTSAALIGGNDITDQASTGIFVMTGPARNSLAGNEISGSPTGIEIGGTDSYVADNVLRENDLGLRIETTSSIYERNVILDNQFGAATWSLLPTNRVVENDFVGNDRHVSRSAGPLRIWTHEGVGNYWEGAVGKTDGSTIDRRYSPTANLDSQLHRTDGAPALAQAPALAALAGVEETVSGMRSGEIVDTAPLCEPANVEWFDRNDETPLEPTCGATG